ncbi:hypothetical protein GCM10009700_34770 [Brevibacterium sanguinis]|uniref:hypothetical protein n=1 Tax=Brevibacterium sanguinis TaxID=232444 RepID=UPI0031CE0ECA
MGNREAQAKAANDDTYFSGEYVNILAKGPINVMEATRLWHDGIKSGRWGQWHPLSHFRRYCTAENFGAWANALFTNSRMSVPRFVEIGILSAQTAANERQRIQGLFEAAGVQKLNIPARALDAGQSHGTVESLLAVAAVPDSLESQHYAWILRGISALNQLGHAQAAGKVSDRFQALRQLRGEPGRPTRSERRSPSTPRQVKSAAPVFKLSKGEATAEQHRQVLLRSPVASRVLEDWVEQIDKGANPTRNQVVRHLRVHCHSDNVGLWARTMFDQRSWTIPSYVRNVMRLAYRTATDAERARALVVIFTDTTVLDASGLIGEGSLTARRYEQLAKIALPGPLTKEVKGVIRNGLTALGSIGAHAAVPAFSARFQQLKLEAQAEALPAPGESTKWSAVAVRRDACLVINSALTKATRHEVSAETAFLASELTVHHRWTLVCETPVVTTVDERRIDLTGMTVETTEVGLKATITTASSRRQLDTVTVPLSGRHTYAEQSVEKIVVVLLAILFEDTHSLVKTGAKRDRQLIGGAAPLAEISPTGLYRTVEGLAWTLSSSTHLVSAGMGRRQRPHERRGYTQVRNGTRVNVKSYRTGNHEKGRPSPAANAD